MPDIRCMICSEFGCNNCSGALVSRRKDGRIDLFIGESLRGDLVTFKTDESALECARVLEAVAKGKDGARMPMYELSREDAVARAERTGAWLGFAIGVVAALSIHGAVRFIAWLVS